MEIYKRLLKDGHIINMESTLPPMTGAAWPTIYTGLMPGEHGVPDFFVMKKDHTPDLVYFDSERTPPFWKKLASSGLKCLVITPATDIKLPDYQNIDMITGFPLKAKTNSRLLDSLMKKHDFYGEPDVEKDMKEGKMSDEEGTKHFIKSIKSRVAIAEEAMEKKDYDFIYVCFTETDRLQHFVLNKKNMKEYLLPIYQEMGKYISYAVKKADEEGAAVMIVSDHGAQPINEKFLINTWMVNEKYAQIKDSIMAEIYSKEPKKQAAYDLREKLLKTKLRKAYDKLPHAAKGVVSKSMGKFLSAAGTGGYTRLHLFDYDMSKTKAFAAISNINVATIWVNDSRFNGGIVDKKDKAKIKTEITQKLKKLKDSKGNPLIINVWDGDEYYHNTKEFLQPDLLAEVRPGFTIDIFHFSKNSLFMEPEPPKRGDHTRLGIFGIYPKIPKPKSGVFLIQDVSPTILSYYGIGKK